MKPTKHNSLAMVWNSNEGLMRKRRERETGLVDRVKGKRVTTKKRQSAMTSEERNAVDLGWPWMKLGEELLGSSLERVAMGTTSFTEPLVSSSSSSSSFFFFFLFVINVFFFLFYVLIKKLKKKKGETCILA